MCTYRFRNSYRCYYDQDEYTFVCWLVALMLVAATFSLIMVLKEIIPSRSTISHSSTSNETLPNIISNKTGDLIKEFNISTWNLPSSTSDCIRMVINTGNYPTFIDEEYRCYMKNDSCDDSGNVLECWSFLFSPREYLRKYFNKTIKIPKSMAECSLRENVRRMDLSNESWFYTLPTEKEGHRMYQCKEYFKRKLDQNNTTSTPPSPDVIRIMFNWFLFGSVGLLTIGPCIKGCCFKNHPTSPTSESIEVGQRTTSASEATPTTRTSVILSRASSPMPTETAPKTSSQESPPSYDQATSLPSYREAACIPNQEVAANFA